MEVQLICGHTGKCYVGLTVSIFISNRFLFAQCNHLSSPSDIFVAAPPHPPGISLLGPGEETALMVTKSSE